MLVVMNSNATEKDIGVAYTDKSNTSNVNKTFTITGINIPINIKIDCLEKNPVLLDLSFLENESPANFKLAGEKIKQMRTRYGAQALLLSRSSEKNLIILSPKKVKLIKKS